MRFLFLTGLLVSLLIFTTAAAQAELQPLSLVDAAAGPVDANHGLYAAAGPSYPLTARATVELPRPGHEKPLRLRVTWAPQAADMPVVIWSHGAFGSKDGYDPLVDYWARQGYAVIQPNHADSIQEGATPDLKNPLSFKNWDERPAEISFLIDSLPAIERQVPALDGRLQRGNIAAGGHSFGAQTMQLLAGMTAKRLFGFGGDNRKHFADSRIKGFLIVSPQGTSRIADAASFAGIKTPFLMVTGTNDNAPVHDQDYTWRLEAWRYAPPGGKYLLFIDGAWHNFGGISGARFPGAGPASADQVDILRSGTLAFLDMTLRDNKAARAYLNSDALRKATAGAAQFTAK